MRSLACHRGLEVRVLDFDRTVVLTLLSSLTETVGDVSLPLGGKMLRKILMLLVVVGALSAFAFYGSALFTSSKDVGGNAFTSGTVILGTNPATTLVTFDTMAPRDQVTAPITVSNDGTLDFRYAVTSLADNTDTLGLASQLVLTIKTGVTTCTNAGFATNGTQVYSGVLGATPLIDIIGDPAAGSDSGDRTLAASANEILCFNVALPDDAPNTVQGATTTATFTFTAEQTKNN